MQIRQQGRKKRIFKRFIWSYFLILILPLIFAFFAYNEAVKIVERDARESRLSILNHTREMLDKYLKDIDETLVQMSMNPKLNGFMHISPPTSNSPVFYDLSSFVMDLRSNTNTNNTFKNRFFIFLKNSDIVLSRDRMDMSIKEFYEDYFNYPEVSYQDFYAQLFEEYHYKDFTPATRAKINGSNSAVIIYMNSLPLGYDKKSQCVVAFVINDEDITTLLQSVKINNSGWYAIVNAKGQRITGSSNGDFYIPDEIVNSKEVSGFLHINASDNNMIYVYTHSQYNDWLYVAALPVDAVMGDVLYVRKIALQILIVSLFLGVLISYILAYYNSKPFKELITTLKDFFNNNAHKFVEEEKSSEYDFLKGSIKHLISDSKNMQEALQRQNETLETVFIDRVLKGEFDDRKKIETIQKHIGWELKGQKYVVILIRINRHDSPIDSKILEELDMFRVLIGDVLDKNIKETCFMHTLNENEIALLINLAFDSEEASISRIVSKVREEIAAYNYITPVFGIGNVYEDLMDTHYSFREAKQALNRLADMENNEVPIIWYSNIGKAYKSYYYPTELEVKLVNNAKSGKWEEIEQILLRIYNENFVWSTLNNTAEKYLIYNIKATLYKLLGEIESDIAIEEIEKIPDTSTEIDKVFKSIRQVYQKICKAMAESKVHQAARLKERILEYLNQNYTNADLSLYAVASVFNFSESAFSQFFKEQVGENFSAYVEGKRIKLACKLLLEEAASIDKIAADTGYNSSHSFRRAFKRAMGVVPTEYLKTYQVVDKNR